MTSNSQNVTSFPKQVSTWIVLTRYALSIGTSQDSWRVQKPRVSGMFSKQVIRLNSCYKTHEIAKNTCLKLVAIFPTKISRSKSGCNISNGVAIFPTPLQYFLLQYFQPPCNMVKEWLQSSVQSVLLCTETYVSDKQVSVSQNFGPFLSPETYYPLHC